MVKYDGKTYEILPKEKQIVENLRGCVASHWGSFHWYADPHGGRTYIPNSLPHIARWKSGKSFPSWADLWHPEILVLFRCERLRDTHFFGQKMAPDSTSNVHHYGHHRLRRQDNIVLRSKIHIRQLWLIVTLMIPSLRMSGSLWRRSC